MQLTIYKIGFISGYIAFSATIAFVVVQALQALGILTFPLDEIAIYSVSLLNTLPLLLQFLSLHCIISYEYKIWTHAALLFMLMYVIFVTANYTVQLGVVVPAEVSGKTEAIAWARQTPQSVFWYIDALGYIAMGTGAFFAHYSIPREGFQGKVRLLLLLHALTTPLIAFVYFYPGYSYRLLLFALPWAITAPAMMLALAMMFRRKYINELPDHHLIYKHLR